MSKIIKPPFCPWCLCWLQNGDWQALETLFLFHGEELRKQRLPLLSCFPETTSPHEYRTLLPEVGFWNNGQDKLEVIPLQQHRHREPDWSENVELRALLEVRSGDLCEFIFEEEPELRPFCGDNLSVEQVSSWYRQRACHIEAHSHQVDCVLSLLRLGVERGVPGLDDLLEELVTLETLVYEAGAEPTFTLENLQHMEDVARLRLLMLNVCVGDFVRDVFRWLVPFLQRVEARDGSSNSLLQQYLLGLASNDLTCPRLIFQNSTPVRGQRVITQDALLMELALECVYACTRTDQLSLCYDILECLPQRKPRKDSKMLKTLHDRVDLLERHLRVVDIMEKYDVHRPVSYVRDSQSDVELAHDLLTHLARLAGRRKPALTESQWEELLQDMLEIEQTVYTCMRTEVCHEIHVKSLLCSGRIETLRLASQRLQCFESTAAQGRHVPYKRSLQLVLQAAREYFNSASSHKDENLELARECLNLIKDHPLAIQEEQDLNLALSLLSEFHVKALPLQVRLCEDRLQLIKQCISRSPTIYKCPGKLLLLASLLRVPDSTGENCGGPVLILLAEQALRSEDLAGASQLCQQLVMKGYKGAWSVCSRVGSCSDCTDMSVRRNFLSFALAHCPPDCLQDLLAKSCSLQAQILYESINSRSKAFVEEDDAVGLELKTEPEEKKGLKERHKEDQALETKGNKNRLVGWTIPAGKLLQQTTERTVSIFSKSTQSTREVLQALTQPQSSSKSLAYLCPLKGHQLETEASLAEELLHATKLAETSYGQEPCSATEVLLQLAEESFPKDVAVGLAYLLATSEPAAVDVWWGKQGPSEPYLQLAIYYYCLQLYANLVSPLSVPQALYEAHPTEVVQEVLSAITFPLEDMACPDVQLLVERLRWACERFADFLQAQSLLNLGCGVDVERFTQDADYKRETILGLAESLEEKPLQLALTLARRYDVPSWEVFLSHTEFLLADNGLSASEVEERITAQDLLRELRNQREAVLSRLACVVFPSLSGRDHARLCTYFGLLKECGCTSHTMHPGQPEAHFQLLQKLHPIAPGCDTTSAFLGHGKRSAWAAWEATHYLTETLVALTLEPEQINSDVHVQRLERMVVIMYSKSSALIQHAKRALLQASFYWNQATSVQQNIPEFSTWGWYWDSTTKTWEPYWTHLADASKACAILLRCGCKKKPALTESQWEELLQDMLEIEQTVYTCMRTEVCHEIHVKSLLCSGRIETLRLASQRLQCFESTAAQGRHVPYKRSLQLVLQAAREYFNSASSHKDENLELARECLNLIKDHPPAIQEEQDLNLALSLLSEFHVKALPLQVRLCEDRLQLIKQCISRSPTIYKCPGKLLLLASLLRVPDSTGENCGGPVLILLAEQALRSEDLAGASQLCQQLVMKGYKGAWSVCSRVGSCSDCTDMSVRRNFLSFALAHCPPDFLQDLLAKSCSLQAQILYESINSRSKAFVEEDDAVGLELKTEPEEKKGLKERHKEDQALETKGNKNRLVGWTIPAGKLLQQTTERTVSIFSKSTQSTREVLQALTQPQSSSKSLAYLCPLKGHQLETEASLAEELLHATKLAETSYGQEPCSATEVLLQLAEESFPKDVAVGLAYLLATSEPAAVDVWWGKQGPSEPYLQLAIYYYCLQLYANLVSPLSVPQALYEAHPTEVVQEVLSAITFPLEDMACPDVQLLVERLRWACERFADFLQAQSLLNLGCGVDVERFTQDADYKRETILGLAESLEEKPLQLALTLARRYDVPSWEVFLSHTEFLLADNGLSASEVEERITAQDLPRELRNQREAVLSRLACVVFPSLSGRDHARLCTYFGLLKECGCTSHTMHSGQPEAHFQLLQKLHPIAPGLDYKQLVMGESPLEAVHSELTAQNVSALATLLAELPGGPTHSIPVSTLFCSWLHLLFWQGGSMKGDDDASVNETSREVLSIPTDQRSTEEIRTREIGETEWLSRFSECEQLMQNLDPPDIGTFLQSVCVSPRAVGQLLLKVRREILERSMLLVQHLAKMKEKEEIGGEAGYMSVLQQLLNWKSHLESLDSDVIQALQRNPEVKLRDLVKAYDEACSRPDDVRRVASKLALAGQPVNQVNALLELCARGHVCSVQNVLQEAMQTVLEALQGNLKTTTEEELIEVEQPIDVLDGLVTSIRLHKEEGGKLVSGEDLLGWLRPFCCDEAVPTMQRARVLQLLDRAFPLEEHDLRLLLCYRTKTVLQHSWPERMLKEEEIESEERRLDLFNELLVSKTTNKQLQQLLLLLQAWPAFQPSVLINERCPWLQLLAAMLNSKPEIQELEQQFERHMPCDEGQHLVAAVREQARTKHPLPWMCLQHLMLLLEKNGFLFPAVCLGLDSNTKELQELALHCASKLSSVEASACSTQLLPIVLSHKLLSACLSTPLYSALAAQLSRERDELSSDAVMQLRDAGQHLHASSLLMAVQGTHPGLATLSAALALHH
uniref:NBAS subunit of NRZ tethering complex-like n=1 Tax=Myxine glutinosa TaxID=7769 RepID=UPI0035900FC5